MSHPLGDLITQHLHRKAGLNQSVLDAGIDQPRSVVGLMCQGQRLTGPLARNRVVSIIHWLYEQEVLSTVDEANLLLKAAEMAALNPGQADEARLLRGLHGHETQVQPATQPAASARLQSRSHSRLPSSLTSFIGRHREIGELIDLLSAPTTRLLTLIGPGGCGKTRLALEAAHQIESKFDKRTYWVDLAQISDPALLPQSVAGALGLREQTDVPLLDTVIEALQEDNILLVMDNCEHIVEACAHLLEALLQSCPNVQIVATSREVVDIPGETIWLVPSLSLPKNELQVESSKLPVGSIDSNNMQPSICSFQPATLLESEAAQLFVERAVAESPQFALTAQNAAAIITICNRLDGIPLALELAAARMKILTAEQLAARLDDAFHLLSGNRRLALPRHQTLRATIDWSYNLLDHTEQTLLRRLALFSGGFTLPASEAVCSGAGIAPTEILDLLSRLVEKSLVQVIQLEQDGEARYRMLETIRQYAREKLQASGELDEVALRHRDWCLAFAEQVETKLYGDEQTSWVQRLEAEHDNVRTALQWTHEHSDIAAGLRFVGALSSFWDIRGYWSERQTWLGAFLQRQPADHEDRQVRVLRAKVLAKAGYLAGQQGDATRALNLLQESLQIYRSLDDKPGIAYVLWTLGWILRNQGATEQAIAYSQEGLKLYRALDDTLGIARVLNILGSLAWYLGDNTAATAYYQESLSLFQSLGDQSDIALVYSMLGHMERDRGNYDQAIAYYLEDLALNRAIGEKTGTAWALNYLGCVTSLAGDAVQAWSYLEESLPALREVGERRGVAVALMFMSRALRLQGDLVQAEALAQESVRLARQVEDSMTRAQSLIILGEVEYALGHLDLAASHYREGLLHHYRRGYKLGCIQCLERLAGVAAAHQDYSQAARLWGAAEAVRSQIGTPKSPEEDAAYTSQVTEAHRQLDEKSWSAAWAAGMAMTLEQAVRSEI